MAADIWLLGHDDRTGRPLLQARPLGTGMAGGLLADLMLAGLIGLRPDGAVMITRAASREMAARDQVLRLVAAEPWPQPAGSWLRFLARSAALGVAQGLEAAGYVAQARSRLPWQGARWVPVNPDWAFAPMLEVRSVLDPARPVTARAGVLAGLAVACGLGFRLEKYQDPRGRPVREAVARLSPGLQELVAQVQAAVDGAVLSHRA